MRDALARLLAVTRISALAMRLAAGASRVLPIIAYHRILDIGNEDDFPYDPDLVSASVADFTWQMEALRRYCQPLYLSEVLRLLEQKRPLPPRAVVVTFDDGHRDNYTNAFPVLRSLGVPATIFLSTGYIDREETFWFDEVVFLLQRTARREIGLRTLGMRLTLENVAQRRRAAEDMLAKLKLVPNAARLDALQELAAESGVSGSSIDVRSRPLTWQQVREMQDGGVEFGSHTVSHPILSQMNDEDVRRELSASKQVLDRQLGRSVNLFAYPVGKPNAFDQRVVSIACECGYRMALTYVSGVNSWPLRDSYRLRRIPIERYTTRARFLGTLAFPELFS